MADIDDLEDEFRESPGGREALLDAEALVDVRGYVDDLVEAEEVDDVEVVAADFEDGEGHGDDGDLVDVELEAEVVRDYFFTFLDDVALLVEGGVESEEHVEDVHEEGDDVPEDLVDAEVEADFDGEDEDLREDEEKHEDLPLEDEPVVRGEDLEGFEAVGEDLSVVGEGRVFLECLVLLEFLVFLVGVVVD